MLDKIRNFFPEEQPATKVLFGLIAGLFIIMSVDMIQHFDLDNPLKALLMSPPSELLLRWGAHIRGLFVPWRIITSVLVHVGLVHLLFNAYALKIIGPRAEGWYGSAMAFAIFVFTGVGAAAASNLLGTPGVLAAGASGGLMGWLGLVCVGGHREGSAFGLAVRDGMLRWAGFVIVFGIFMGADNIAHVGGLVLGAGIGFVLPAPSSRPASSGLRGAGALLSVVALGILGMGLYGMGMSQVGKKEKAAQVSEEKTTKRAKEARIKDCLKNAQKGDIEKSIEYCERAVKKVPEDFRGYIQLAVLYASRDDLKAARGVFSRPEAKKLSTSAREGLSKYAFSHCKDLLSKAREFGEEKGDMSALKSSPGILFCEEGIKVAPLSTPTLSSGYLYLLLHQREFGTKEEVKVLCLEAKSRLPAPIYKSRLVQTAEICP